MSELDVVRAWVDSALAALEASRQRIDDLNVYPVPDGDTGTNLTLTVRALRDSLLESNADDRTTLAKDVTRGALLGARGNSGVILSQIVRGAAESLAQELDVPRAARAASDAAYAAVRQPVEGTMLSVVREIAEEAESHGGGGDRTELLRALVRRGETAVARTPEQLDVLRHAGVVDAGGAGLLEIVRGVVAAATGEPIPPAPPVLAVAGYDAVHQEQSRYRYCTVFVVEGDDLDKDGIEDELDEIGDSLLVVGDGNALKVHVHTDDPGRALQFGTAVGTISRVEIANMQQQAHQREERLTHALDERRRSAVVAVVAGDGNRRLFESLGATSIVEGGQTMNPSTADLVAAIASADGVEVLLLPNNSNVILAAEQAAELAQQPVQVIPTQSLQAGLAVMVAFDPTRDADGNATEMREALAAVATGEVTRASRDVELDGLSVRKGTWIGLADGHAVAGGADFDEVAGAVVERLLGAPRGVLTLLTGDEQPQLDGLLNRIAERYPEVEVDVQEGGQPHYPLLLSAE